jgi:hypothetical protein
VLAPNAAAADVGAGHVRAGGVVTLAEATPGTHLRLAILGVTVRVMSQSKYGTWTRCRCVLEDGLESEPISMPGSWRGERITETNNATEEGNES